MEAFHRRRNTADPSVFFWLFLSSFFFWQGIAAYLPWNNRVIEFIMHADLHFSTCIHTVHLACAHVQDEQKVLYVSTACRSPSSFHFEKKKKKKKETHTIMCVTFLWTSRSEFLISFCRKRNSKCSGWKWRITCTQCRARTALWNGA